MPLVEEDEVAARLRDLTFDASNASDFVDRVLKAFFPPISAALGPYVPLIITNCIVLGRAEAFASKNGIVVSIADGLGIGIGFTLSLAALGNYDEVIALRVANEAKYRAYLEQRNSLRTRYYRQESGSFQEFEYL